MPEVPEATPAVPEEPWNPPAADADWGELFGESPEPTPQVAAPEPAATPEPAPEPEPPRAPEFYLEVPTGTRYKTKDEAIRGYEEKDRVIADLRGKVIALAGVDPLSRRGSNGEPQPSPNQSYLQDPDRYARDLTESAEKKQYRDYLATQARLIDEVVQARYGHILPVVEKVGRQEALESVSSEIPSFKDFLKSDEYSKTLDESPALKRAIQASETNPQYQQDLPELYKLAYKANLANKTPELVRGSQTPQTPTPRMPSTGATGMRAPLVVPDTVGGRAPAKPALNSSEGRKALMRELEAKGVLDLQF